ncbi:CAP domain-containing protein [Deinococcus sp. YIM 134068]|uniref:CAP domain-containing protein n=1 Tax=Deinococcus lichenicola TaxID=3118910 RepID=UPI002F925321
MKRVLIPLLILTGDAGAQSIRPALEQTFASCGLTLTRSAHLDRVAQAYTRHGAVKPSAAEAGYAYQQMQGLRVNGQPGAFLQAVRERCGTYQGLIAYGLAPHGRGYALVVADPKIPPGLRGAAAEGRQLLAATNAARARGANCGGVRSPPAPPLIWDDRLFAAAQLYAQRLATLNFTGHVDPYTGSAPENRAAQAGFRGGVGENLQHGGNTAELAVARLLTSPGHCRNMLDPAWQVMGGAYWASEQSNHGIHWVQLFGRP